MTKKYLRIYLTHSETKSKRHLNIFKQHIKTNHNILKNPNIFFEAKLLDQDKSTHWLFDLEQLAIGDGRLRKSFLPTCHWRQMLQGRRHKMTMTKAGFFCKRLPICPWKPQMKDRSRCFCEVENSMGCAMLLGMPLFSTMNYDILMLSMTFLAVVISWKFMTDLGGFCWFHSLSYLMLQRNLPHSISVKSMAPSTLPWDFSNDKVRGNTLNYTVKQLR